MSRPAFDTMAARVFVLLLAGILAAATLAFIVSGVQARATAAAEREQRLVDRIADAAAVLAATPADARPDVLGVGPEALRLGDVAGPGRAALDPILSARVNQRLGSLAVAQVSAALDGACPGPAPAGPPPPAPVGPPPPLGPGEADAFRSAPPPPPAPVGCRLVRLAFPSGATLGLIAPSGPRPPSPPLPLSPAPLVAMVLVAAGVAWSVARLAVAPLARLGNAARALGSNLDRAPLVPAGPQEVRQAAVAFNAMQARLQGVMEERTHMLAAITHDLQTPLTRQRLRLERVDDLALREELIADQSAMRTLIREGLDLARAGHDGEAAVALDIDSVLDSLAADAVAVGQDVQVVGSCDCMVRTCPQAIVRCLANLLDNALKYAGAAELSAARTHDGQVVVRVSDRGPGVAPSELEHLFQPFRRSETSRTDDGGGVGLGLTIARMLAERGGGRLTLHNRDGGGLEARLLFEPNL